MRSILLATVLLAVGCGIEVPKLGSEAADLRYGNGKKANKPPVARFTYSVAQLHRLG